MKYLEKYDNEKDNKVGSKLWFEYHCDESKKSVDYQLYLKSHQIVTVLSISEFGGGNTLKERLENGEPRVYKVKFSDGEEHDVFEDELLNDQSEFTRPDPPIKEAVESKKPKSDYFSKKITISKPQLEQICDFLNLPFDEVKFLSSGAYGNAYQIGDKVLKLTTDKQEAKSVYDILKYEQNESIVRYYDISRYKLNNRLIYVILMDKVTPLDKYMSRIKNIDFGTLDEYIDDVTDLMMDEWNNMKTKKDFLKLIDEDKGWDVPTSRFMKKITDDLWDLYVNLRHFIKTTPDVHSLNLGYTDDGRLVLFDVAELTNVRKFDAPRILKDYDVLESNSSSPQTEGE